MPLRYFGVVAAGRFQAALVMSVRAKSAPLNSSGSPVVSASAKAKTSPKARPAGWRPLTPAAQRVRGVGCLISRNGLILSRVASCSSKHVKFGRFGSSS